MLRTVLAVILCIAVLPVAAAAATTVSGTALYRERIMPPPGSVLVAVIEDAARADAPATEIARQELAITGAPPFAFSIPYAADKITPAGRYVLRVSLMGPDGRLLFTTDTVTQVISNGVISGLEVIMRKVNVQGTAPTSPLGAHVGAHGLRLPASFLGTLPCADCEGIQHHLDLWPDQTYHLSRIWLKGNDSTRRDELGRWHAEPSRNAIVLYGAGEMPLQFEVKTADKLRALGMDGQRIESKLPYDLVSTGALNEGDLENLFLGGMMIYMADAALFTECLTGKRYPIVQDGDYLALERAYIADRPSPGAELYVHVEGGLLMRPAMEGPDRRSLVVKRFIKTVPGEACERHQSTAQLTNTYWRIDTLGKDTVSAEPGRREPHIVLQDADGGRYKASMGCNTLIGGFTRKDDALSFSNPAGTLMACPPPLQALERELAEILSAARGFKISSGTLLLQDASGQPLATLTAVYLK